MAGARGSGSYSSGANPKRKGSASVKRNFLKENAKAVLSPRHRLSESPFAAEAGKAPSTPRPRKNSTTSTRPKTKTQRTIKQPHSPTASAPMDPSRFDSKVNVARAQRKKAEGDVQLLTNRIALLKAEMGKAQKNIDRTKTRTVQIQKNAAVNVDRMRLRQQQEASRKRDEQKQKRRNAETKQVEESLRNQSRAKIERQRRDEVAKVKQLKEENKQRRQTQLEEERKRALATKEKVRKERQAAQARALAEKEAKARQLQLEVEAKILAEQEAAAAKQREIGRLEKMELELIEMLQQTQFQQTQARTELEHALTRDTSIQASLTQIDLNRSQQQTEL